jgi:predicted lipid-binding transport protein (Tim44 family)
LIISDCPELWARAGGGGGGGATGILYLILLPFFIIYSMIVTYMVVKKNKECQSLMQQCADIDSAWNPDSVKARIEQAFLKIQQAWVERNQDIAKDYMSERLYNKHKTQTDAMIVNQRKNILDRLNLIEAKVVQVADFKDNSKDSFWVYLEASAIDYEIDEASGSITSGKKDKEESFAELWKFIRLKNTWVVDEIDQKVSVGDLSHLKSLVER